MEILRKMNNFQPRKFVAIDLKHKLYKFHKIFYDFNKSPKHGTTKLHPNMYYNYENGILLILVIFVDDRHHKGAIFQKSNN
jgi:hypothetical protein